MEKNLKSCVHGETKPKTFLILATYRQRKN